MDIVGKVIIHTKLNGKENVRGNIIKAAEKGSFVEICFEGDNVPSRKYDLVSTLIPDNATNKLLYSDDSNIYEWAKTKKQLYYCSNCNKYSTQLSSESDNLLCPTCAKDLIPCSHCGKKILRNSRTTWERGGLWFYCQSCFEDNFTLCAKCGSYEYKDRFYSGKNPKLFNVCWIHLVHCDRCYRYFSEEEIQHIDGNDLCEECYKQAVGTCEKCGKKSKHLEDALCPFCQCEREYISIFGNPDFFLGKRAYVEGTWWFKNMDTVPLMSKLKQSSSDKVDMIIIKNHLFCNGKNMSIVIVPSKIEIQNMLSECECTMTELKTDSEGAIRGYLSWLIEQGKCWVIEVSEHERLHLFKNPYHIRAMTYDDMDYGNARNQYGDTSDFLIIGALDSIF